MSFVQEPTVMNVNDRHILRFENVIPDLISGDQCAQNEGIFLMPYAL